MMRVPRRDLTSPRDATDAQLFEAIATGDLGPLGTLFDRHHEEVRQFLLRAAPHDADVDDLVQETFLTASRAAASFDGRESGRPFLIGVAAQLVRRRRRTFARLRTLLDAFGAAPVSAPRTPEESTSAAQEEERMRAAIASLSDDRRLVLVMVEYNGLSGVEVAKIIDKPVGTVWRRLHEARAEIRRTLTRGAQ
ncbi:RNA polymerase ECF-subfamily sigma factor [Minicystis rosea]|nr:RNA polymerase ECF-subfamily sigma factor [Minicystis rosea]